MPMIHSKYTSDGVLLYDVLKQMAIEYLQNSNVRCQQQDGKPSFFNIKKLNYIKSNSLQR